MVCRAAGTTKLVSHIQANEDSKADTKPEEQPSCDLTLLQSSLHLSIDWLLHSIMSH